MNKFIIIVSLIAVLLFFTAFKAKQFVDKINYDYSVKNVKLIKIGINEPSQALVSLNINIKNDNNVKIKIEELYYEVYYKGNLLAKSASKSSLEIPPKTQNEGRISFNEDVTVFLDKNNLEVAKNYLANSPTDYLVKASAKIYGIKVNLNKIKITY